MIAITTYLTPEEATAAVAAANAIDMNLQEYARWSIVIQSASIESKDAETIDQPWGAPVEDTPADQPKAEP